MANMFRHRKGFTLTEILVSAVILAVLAGVAMPLAKIAVKRGKELELQRSLRLMREAIDQYKRLADEKKIEFDEDTDGYPPSLEVLVNGVKLKDEGKGSDKSQGSKDGTKIKKLLRRIPKDPMTDSMDWGLLSSQDAPDSTSWGGQNVFDVYTKSTKTAIDGTKYKDW
jgi:general secretion pathway protein G